MDKKTLFQKAQKDDQRGGDVFVVCYMGAAVSIVSDGGGILAPPFQDSKSVFVNISHQLMSDEAQRGGRCRNAMGLPAL